MVEKNQEAALMGVQPKAPARAAQLCFDKVDSHFGAISALLGNDQVFDEVARTLRQMKDSNDPVEEKKAVAVALAALAGGQAMDVNSEDWPTAVRQVLRERQDTSEKYWREKKKKFELQKEKSPSVVVPISHKPFFSADPRKLKEPFKFPVETHGKSFSESHFVQALLDHSKVVLKELSAANFSRLNLDHLEAGALKTFRGRAQTMVHVTPGNFGKLLARLSHRVSKDGQRDFRGMCCLRGAFGDGHDMVVSLSKKPHGDPMVKVPQVVAPFRIGFPVKVGNRPRQRPGGCSPLSSTFEAYIEEGLTYEQAAKSLSIPIGTVRSRIFRVRELVQDC